MTTISRSLLSLGLLALLSACGDAAPDSSPAVDSIPEGAASIDTVGEASQDATTSPIGSAGSSESPAPSRVGAGPEQVGGAPSGVAHLTLEGEGLRVFIAATGSARPLAFGDGEEGVVDAVTRVLGAPPREQGLNMDCAARYAVWEDGLTLWFAEGRFVGWAIRPGSSLTTVSGIGIGSTRADIEAVHVARIAPSSLGTEFSVGGLAGLLDSPAPVARVTNLWAGVTCIAR